MIDSQSSIEGQVLVKATAEIVSKASFSKDFNVEEVVGIVFDALEKKLTEYKSKKKEEMTVWDTTT